MHCTRRLDLNGIFLQVKILHGKKKVLHALNCINLLFKQNQTQQLRQQLEGEIKNQENVKKILQETRQQLEQTKEQVC